MNFQVTEQNNKNLKTSKLNRCIAFTSLSPSSTTTPPPTTTLTASLRSFSLLSLNFQIQGTLFPVLSIRISTCTTSVAAWSVLTLIHNFHLFFLFFLEGWTRRRWTWWSWERRKVETLNTIVAAGLSFILISKMFFVYLSCLFRVSCWFTFQVLLLQFFYNCMQLCMPLVLLYSICSATTASRGRFMILKDNSI